MTEEVKTQEQINEEILAADAEAGYVDERLEDKVLPREVPEVDYAFVIECDIEVASRVMTALEAEGFDTLNAKYIEGELRFIEGDETKVDGLVNDFTASKTSDNLVEQASSWKLKVREFADELYDKLLEGYSKAEVASFGVKGPAARAVIENRATSDQMDLLSAEADRLGVTVEVLAAKIDPRSTLFTKVSGEIAAFRTVSENTLDGVTDVNAFESTVNQLLIDAQAAMAEYGITN